MDVAHVNFTLPFAGDIPTHTSDAYDKYNKELAMYTQSCTRS